MSGLCTDVGNAGREEGIPCFDYNRLSSGRFSASLITNFELFHTTGSWIMAVGGDGHLDTRASDVQRQSLP